jgi:hypothetical protein
MTAFLAFAQRPSTHRLTWKFSKRTKREHPYRLSGRTSIPKTEVFSIY